jgi:hypothetical protein
MAGSAMCSVKGYTRYMMRPFGKLDSDCTYAIVIADQTRSMLRCGYVMALNAVLSGWHLGTVDATDFAGGMTMGTVAADETTSFGLGKKRSKVLSGVCKAACGMTRNASISGKRVWKWNRTDAIVLGTTAMTALATEWITPVMNRCKIICNNG